MQSKEMSSDLDADHTSAQSKIVPSGATFRRFRNRSLRTLEFRCAVRRAYNSDWELGADHTLTRTAPRCYFSSN